jgi:hypothetical protein
MSWFHRKASRRPLSPLRFCPTLEALEDRLAPAAVGGETFDPSNTPAFAVAFIAPLVQSTTFAAFLSGPGLSGNGLPGVGQPITSLTTAVAVSTPGGQVSVGTPGGNGPAEFNNTQTISGLLSPFSQATFVAPQTPPPRAVTLFAPSGGGDNPLVNPVPVPNPEVQGNPPGGGAPAAPAPATAACP